MASFLPHPDSEGLQPAHPWAEVVVVRLFDEEVDIGAVGVEFVGRGRAEELETFDTEFATERSNRLLVLLDQRVHTASSFRIASYLMAPVSHKGISVDAPESSRAS